MSADTSMNPANSVNAPLVTPAPSAPSAVSSSGMAVSRNRDTITDRIQKEFARLTPLDYAKGFMMGPIINLIMMIENIAMGIFRILSGYHFRQEGCSCRALANTGKDFLKIVFTPVMIMGGYQIALLCGIISPEVGADLHARISSIIRIATKSKPLGQETEHLVDENLDETDLGSVKQ